MSKQQQDVVQRPSTPGAFHPVHPSFPGSLRKARRQGQAPRASPGAERGAAAPAEHPPGRSGDGEPAPAEPTHGTPDLVFPLVTHGKTLVLQRLFSRMGVSAFEPRSPFIFIKIFGMKTSRFLTFLRSLPHLMAFSSPLACVQGWLCKPRSISRPGSSLVVLPVLNFLGIIIVFERLLQNSGGSLEGFHCPAPATCVLVLIVLPMPPAALGPPKASRRGLQTWGDSTGDGV